MHLQEAASVKDDGVNGQGDPVQASPRRPSRVPLTAAILRCGWKSLEVGINRKLPSCTSSDAQRTAFAVF